MSETFTHKYIDEEEEGEQGGVAVLEQEESTDDVADIQQVQDFSRPFIVDVPEESTDTVVDHEREQAFADFERNREQAFAHALEFDRSIAELRHEIVLSKDKRANGPEYEDLYNTQLHFLNHQLEKQQAVEKFERMLWGDTPEEHVDGKRKLLEDIALIKSPQDILVLFDKWGALPGASTVDRPSINREAIASFLDKIQQRSDVPNLEERAEKLFPNKRLRQKVLQLRVSELEVPYRESAPEVWTEEEPLPSEGYDQVNQSNSIQKESELAKGSSSRFAGEVVDTEQEIRELRSRERALTEAEEIIDSPVFRYAPFLMRLTQKGRESLAKVKSAGFTLDTRGASPETLEMARALKLKSIRERLAQLTENTNIQVFAHNLSSREKSVKKAVQKDYANPLPDVRREHERDSVMLRGAEGTGRVNARRIANVIAPEYSGSRVSPEQETYPVEDNQDIVRSDHSEDITRSNAPIARRGRVTKKTEVKIVDDSNAQGREVQNQTESQEEIATRKALEVFNRKKAQKTELADKVARVTGKTNLSKKGVRTEATKISRKKKKEETNN